MLTEGLLTSVAFAMVVVLSTLIIAFPRLFTKVNRLVTALALSTYVTFPENKKPGLIFSFSAQRKRHTPCRIVHITPVIPAVEKCGTLVFAQGYIDGQSLP